MKSRIFKIERVSSLEGVFEYRAEIIPDHPVFGGHFPGSPVVPGVCSMKMIKDCLEDAMSRPMRYSYIKECKFLSAIIPTQHHTLDVSLTIRQESPEDCNVTAEVAAQGTKMIKLKATLI